MMDFMCGNFFLLLLTCAGLSVGQNLSLPAMPDRAAGETVTFTPTNIPPPPHLAFNWSFISPHEKPTHIVTVVDGVLSTWIYFDSRVSVNLSTLALELRHLTKNDAGTYRLTVRTKTAVEAAETSLRVYGKVSDAVITVPQDDLIDEISSAKITCNGKGHIIRTSWMKDNQMLPAAENIAFSSDKRTMMFFPIRREDAGEYRCTISNPLSSATAKTTIKVNFGPEHVQITGPKEVDEGTPVTLTCTAESTPVPSYRWDFNGIRTRVTKSEYTVNQTSFNNSGKYTCTAANSITNRNATATHTLKIKEKSPGTLSVKTIIGIAFGGLVLIAGTAEVIFYFMKMKRTQPVETQGEVIELPFEVLIESPTELPTEVQEQ